MSIDETVIEPLRLALPTFGPTATDESALRLLGRSAMVIHGDREDYKEWESNMVGVVNS